MRLTGQSYATDVASRPDPERRSRPRSLGLSGRNRQMVKFALLVVLNAKPGKEAAVEAFLRASQPVVQDEPGTVAWFGLRMGPSTFAIFDAFPDEEGRQAHLSGRVAAALMERAPDLFASTPQIEKLDVLAAKMP
ncbi:quinol monooxygenase YgiN [Methylorubrum rhodinum]|uniref:Quinol monooxygenase YgiN n=2 Tax=Methylorubrum rhodinum TaxID=29428 RepID=A0A840ZJ38_9HYPH|nr:quinol monooxygenase YgiN [Methylorubrum rhodinum]